MVDTSNGILSRMSFLKSSLMLNDKSNENSKPLSFQCYMYQEYNNFRMIVKHPFHCKKNKIKTTIKVISKILFMKFIHRISGLIEIPCFD